jgi:hypothetical protein
LERETGARGLRSIIEDALLDVMFAISKGLKPTLVTSAGAEAAGEEVLAEETARFRGHSPPHSIRWGNHPKLRRVEPPCP